jgi:hypothetical protein
MGEYYRAPGIFGCYFYRDKGDQVFIRLYGSTHCLPAGTAIGHLFGHRGLGFAVAWRPVLFLHFILSAPRLALQPEPASALTLLWFLNRHLPLPTSCGSVAL